MENIEERKYIVYKATNKINGKMYIGITCQKLKDRIREHKYEAFKENSPTYNTPFKRAIRKYKIENFIFEVIESDLTQDKASEKEIYYIQKFNTYCNYTNSNGYNATTGGEKSQAHPKDRVVQINKMTGELIKVYPSTKYAEKIFGVAINMCVSKRIQSCYGYCWMYEKEYLKMTKQERYDYVNSICEHIIQFDLDGNILHIYESITEAANKYNISTSAISRVILKEKCSCVNSIWMYYSDYLKYGFQKKEKRVYMKAIYQLDNNKNIINEFPSLVNAAEFVKTKDSNISTAISRNGKCAGYYWKYKDT